MNIQEMKLALSAPDYCKRCKNPLMGSPCVKNSNSLQRKPQRLSGVACHHNSPRPRAAVVRALESVVFSKFCRSSTSKKIENELYLITLTRRWA